MHRFPDTHQGGALDWDQEAIAEGWPACQDAVLNCFPDMCPEYLMRIATQLEWDHEEVIIHVLDRQENGSPYPTRTKPSKRKRPDGDEQNTEGQRKDFEKDESRLVGKDAAFVQLHHRTS